MNRSKKPPWTHRETGMDRTRNLIFRWVKAFEEYIERERWWTIRNQTVLTSSSSGTLYSLVRPEHSWHIPINQFNIYSEPTHPSRPGSGTSWGRLFYEYGQSIWYQQEKSERHRTPATSPIWTGQSKFSTMLLPPPQPPPEARWFHQSVSNSQSLKELHMTCVTPWKRS
jgi:hypothetical protein